MPHLRASVTRYCAVCGDALITRPDGTYVGVKNTHRVLHCASLFICRPCERNRGNTANKIQAWLNDD